MTSHPDEANFGEPPSTPDDRPYIEEDRRQSPRVDLLREFQGRLLALDERDLKLADLVERLSDSVDFPGRKVLYSWIGGTRRDWRGQGQFRALTEEQEVWAVGAGYDEVVIKTKNKFFDMRGTLDTLGFEVVKFERHPDDNGESKVYLSKRLGPGVLDSHRTVRTVVRG